MHAAGVRLLATELPSWLSSVLCSLRLRPSGVAFVAITSGLRSG